MEFLELYFEVLETVLDIPEESKVAYVMEKSSPIYDSNKKVMKDGVHIIMPNIVSGYAPPYFLQKHYHQNPGCFTFLQTRFYQSS